MRIVVGLFLIAHGLVHLMYLGPRPDDDPNYPFVPEARWVARWRDLEPGAAKAVAGSLAVATAHQRQWFGARRNGCADRSVGS